MSYSSNEGYVPSPISEIMSQFRLQVNTTFGTDYTTDSFVGTNFYKFFYATAQRVAQNETRAAEIFLKLQEYFNEINAQILRPSVTPNGLIDALGEEGYLASVKPIISADAGKLFVCVDVDNGADDYAAQKLLIATIIKEHSVAGTVSQGDQTQVLTLTNSQEFTFKFNLPDRIEPLLRLTLTTSRNNEAFIKSPEDIKAALMVNIAARYNLGKDFEPEIYFNSKDAPWASNIKLEYSVDAGSSWLTVPFTAAYDELYVILLANITVVEN